MHGINTKLHDTIFILKATWPYNRV